MLQNTSQNELFLYIFYLQFSSNVTENKLFCNVILASKWCEERPAIIFKKSVSAVGINTSWCGMSDPCSTDHTCEIIKILKY